MNRKYCSFIGFCSGGAVFFVCLVMMFGMMIGGTMSARAATKTITWDKSVLRKVRIGNYSGSDMNIHNPSFENAGIKATWVSGKGVFFCDNNDISVMMMGSNDGSIIFASSLGKIKNIAITCGRYDQTSSYVYGNISGWKCNFTGEVGDGGEKIFTGDVTWSGNSEKKQRRNWRKK